MSDFVRRRDRPEPDSPPLDIDRVGRDVLSDGKVVSTVRLCVEHSWKGGGGYWFETMVFASETDFGGLECDRYRTRAEAQAGHGRMVERVRAEVKP